MIKLLTTLCTLTLGVSQPLSIRLSDPVPAEVNNMYEQGLDFLLSSQAEDGSWINNNSGHPAVAAFAMMAFLAKRENLNTPKYRIFIENCLNELLEAQDPDTGYIGGSMYNHGFITLALTESYGVIDDERIGPAIMKAVQLILDTQEKNPSKAWRYTPDSNDADTTVTGCQLVALLGARNAGIPVPDDALAKGLAYLESCRSNNGSYGYKDKSNGKPTLTAIGVLSHYLAQKKEDEEIKKSVAYLSSRLDYRDPHYPFYYEYYMSQALFQADQKTWEEWNKRNIRYLKIIQTGNGSWQGSTGEVYSTSAALLSLALNYRLMPIYEKF